MPRRLLWCALVFGLGAGWQPAAHAQRSVLAWGSNLYGQSDVPSGLTNVSGVSAGHYHSLCLHQDGKAVAWGYNGSGQTNLPPNLTGLLKVVAGPSRSLMLRADRTVAVS